MWRILGGNTGRTEAMHWQAVRALVASVFLLLRTWWWQDRIRIGRSCGRLLRLAVGDRLVLADQIWVVVHRWPDPETACPGCAHVEYCLCPWCESSGEVSFQQEPPSIQLPQQPTAHPLAKLVVPLEQQCIVQFVQGEKQRELLTEEIAMLSPSCNHRVDSAVPIK